MGLWHMVGLIHYDVHCGIVGAKIVRRGGRKCWRVRRLWPCREMKVVTEESFGQFSAAEASQKVSIAPPG